MNFLDFIPLLVAVVPYGLVHAIIIFLLLRLRRRLPQEHRTISRGLLVATATPCLGPIVSSIAFATLAKNVQAATATLPACRSDCGHAAGIAYGVIYFAAAWVKSPALGGLSLALLVIYFWQATAGLNALPRGDDSRVLQPLA